MRMTDRLPSVVQARYSVTAESGDVREMVRAYTWGLGAVAMVAEAHK